MRRSLIILLSLAVITSVALKLVQQLEQHYLRTAQQPPLWVVLAASLARGKIGTGTYGKIPNRLDLYLLQPGDILLGGNSGGSYGKYTHAGLYIGENKALDMFISKGIYFTEVETYHNYDWAAILRVKATPWQKKAAINYAKSQIGAPFFILAPKGNNSLWYCSKLIWYAYRQQGINLEPAVKAYWITPDDLMHSKYTQLIAFASAR